MNPLNLQRPDLLQTGSYIHGNWLASHNTYPVCNPATGTPIAEVARAGAAETQNAIDAASAAMAGWRARTAKERGAILRSLLDLI